MQTNWKALIREISVVLALVAMVVLACYAGYRAGLDMRGHGEPIKVQQPFWLGPTAPEGIVEFRLK